MLTAKIDRMTAATIFVFVTNAVILIVPFKLELPGVAAIFLCLFTVFPGIGLSAYSL